MCNIHISLVHTELISKALLSLNNSLQQSVLFSMLLSLRKLSIIFINSNVISFFRLCSILVFDLKRQLHNNIFTHSLSRGESNKEFVRDSLLCCFLNNLACYMESLFVR